VLPSSSELQYKDDIPNLHPTRIAGLDICLEDLEFAIKATAQGPSAQDGDEFRYRARGVTRWEELVVKLWKGGLETVNEEWVGVECIVCMEVFVKIAFCHSYTTRLIEM